MGRGTGTRCRHGAVVARVLKGAERAVVAGRGHVGKQKGVSCFGREARTHGQRIIASVFKRVSDRGHGASHGGAGIHVTTREQGIRRPTAKERYRPVSSLPDCAPVAPRACPWTYRERRGPPPFPHRDRSYASHLQNTDSVRCSSNRRLCSSVLILPRVAVSEREPKKPTAYVMPELVSTANEGRLSRPWFYAINPTYEFAQDT